MQHIHLMVTTGPGLTGDSEAMKSLPGGLIFEMDVFMAIHSHSLLVLALGTPVTLMFMNYAHGEITSLIHVASNVAKSGYFLKAT